MKKLIALLIIGMSIPCLAGCSSETSNEEQAATDNSKGEKPTISVEVPWNGLYSTEDVEILHYQLNPNAIEIFQIVLNIDSSDFSQELLQQFYFETYYPVYEQLEELNPKEGARNYTVEGYIIFTDMDGSPVSSNIGSRMSWSTLIDVYEYIDLDDRGLYKPMTYYTPDVQCFTVDFENKQINYDGDISLFDDTDVETYIVDPQ